MRPEVQQHFSMRQGDQAEPSIGQAGPVVVPKAIRMRLVWLSGSIQPWVLLAWG